MANRRDLSLNDYGISPYRYRELYNWCMQYQDWQKELQEISLVKSASFQRPPLKGVPGNPTQWFAMRRSYLEHNCRLVEQTMAQAVSDICKGEKNHSKTMCKLMILSITHDYRYNHMDTNYDIPCGRDLFNHIRRYFYYLLDQKKSTVTE